MSRKHLEEAIMVGQLIENGLQPIFRFSNVDVYKRVLPVDNPDYEDVSVHCVQFNKDGQFVAIGAANSTVRIVNTAHPYTVRTIKASRHTHGYPITCLRFLTPPHDVLLGCSPSGEIYAMHVDREGFETVVKENFETYCFDVTPNGLELATVGHDLQIRLYDIIMSDGTQYTTLKPIRGFEPTGVDYDLTEGHGMRVFVLRYHPDKHQCLISAGWDNVVKIWDTRMNKGPVNRFYGPHICSPDGMDIRGNEILTASWKAKNALEIWDMRHLHQPNQNGDMQPVETIPVTGDVWKSSPLEAEYLYGGKFCDNNAIIAGGSGFNALRVVNRVTFEEIGEIMADLPVQGIDTIFGGRQISVGSADGSLYLAQMR